MRRMRRTEFATCVALAAVSMLVLAACSKPPQGVGPAGRQVAQVAVEAEEQPALPEVGPHDSPQFGRTPARNNVSSATNLPTHWSIGEFDEDGTHRPGTGENIRWVAPLNSWLYGTPTVANGLVSISALHHVKDNGFFHNFFCLRETDGDLQWRCQTPLAGLPILTASAPELAGMRLIGIGALGSTPLADGDRLWCVTILGELLCLDARGFSDGENDVPCLDEETVAGRDADIVWRLDMVKQLGVHPHDVANCSPTAAGNLLFVCTSNGVDEAHNEVLPAPDAPSFLCLDKRTGEVLWSDNSPGINILHGQWSSPAYGVIGGVAQVIFGGGDGWLYSFRGERTADGKAELLWKFDCNPKEPALGVGDRATRNHIIGAPVIYDDKIYVAIGEDAEHGEGPGLLWCIDSTKRGDVSEELVFNAANPERPIAPKRLMACVHNDGDFTKPNPNSAAIWKYSSRDVNRDGAINHKDFHGSMHRLVSTVAIHDNLLIACDFSGLVHCFDARTGEQHWTYDCLSASYSSPLIADGKVYICDEDGDVCILKLSAEREILTAQESGIYMGNSIYATPVEANGVLFIATKSLLWAIARP